MPKRLHLTLLISTLVAYCFCISPVVAAAAATNPVNAGQALEIAPPVMTLNVDPGQTTSVQIYLRDIAKTNLLVTGQVNDFVAAGEDGTPKILLDNKTPDPYSMRSWITSVPSLNLIPREIKSMTVTINVPKDASPGGHYGVIRFTATPPDLQGTGVSLSASLGALLLVTVSGKITDNVSIDKFSVGQNGKSGSLFETPPVTFSENFKNSGNVHEEPNGQVTITDTLGHLFAVVNVNAPPHNILPSSIRTFNETLDSSVIGNNIMFGRYTATLRMTYGADKKVLTSVITFWVIPYRLIGAIIVILVGSFFGLRFLIRRYNRYIVDQVRKGRR